MVTEQTQKLLADISQLTDIFSRKNAYMRVLLTVSHAEGIKIDQAFHTMFTTAMDNMIWTARIWQAIYTPDHNYDEETLKRLRQQLYGAITSLSNCCDLLERSMERRVH